MIADSEAFALSGIIVAEILQGLTRNVRRIEEYLMQWDLLEPTGFYTFRSAAAIYRMARQRGITPTTIDTIIATIALEHGAAVFTLDKDFNQIAKITGLTLYAF